ncbi:FixH family protein [Peredibacter sp. HCB2-198]|uniref:FixH family protein n=1 Tax=Peredibacter sp. HCB2-198 TaxID=3383025 RepID=UPI0038B5F6B7
MKLIAFLLGLMASLGAFAESGSVCSNATSVCASYESEADFTSKQEGRFALKLTSHSDEELTLVKVDLWMQMGNHGHGSSPLKVVAVAPNEYDVTKAFFVMKGQWQIRVKYKQAETEETLILPIMIRE